VKRGREGSPRAAAGAISSSSSPRKPSTSGISAASSAPYFWTMQPATTDAVDLPRLLPAHLLEDRVDRLLLGGVDEAARVTTTTRELAVFDREPLAGEVPSMTSVSTRFFGHPSETIPTDGSGVFMTFPEGAAARREPSSLSAGARPLPGSGEEGERHGHRGPRGREAGECSGRPVPQPHDVRPGRDRDGKKKPVGAEDARGSPSTVTLQPGSCASTTRTYPAVPASTRTSMTSATAGSRRPDAAARPGRPRRAGLAADLLQRQVELLRQPETRLPEEVVHVGLAPEPDRPGGKNVARGSVRDLEEVDFPSVRSHRSSGRNVRDPTRRAPASRSECGHLAGRREVLEVRTGRKAAHRGESPVRRRELDRAERPMSS